MQPTMQIRGDQLSYMCVMQGFSLKLLKHLVLDEADRLLNMDFEQEIDQILKAIPKVSLALTRTNSTFADRL